MVCGRFRGAKSYEPEARVSKSPGNHALACALGSYQGMCNTSEKRSSDYYDRESDAINVIPPGSGVFDGGDDDEVYSIVIESLWENGTLLSAKESIKCALSLKNT
jgi:hypothetical protein